MAAKRINVVIKLRRKGTTGPAVFPYATGTQNVETGEVSLHLPVNRDFKIFGSYKVPDWAEVHEVIEV